MTMIAKRQAKCAKVTDEDPTRKIRVKTEYCVTEMRGAIRKRLSGSNLNRPYFRTFFWVFTCIIHYR